LYAATAAAKGKPDYEYQHRKIIAAPKHTDVDKAIITAYYYTKPDTSCQQNNNILHFKRTVFAFLLNASCYIPCKIPPICYKTWYNVRRRTQTLYGAQRLAAKAATSF